MDLVDLAIYRAMLPGQAARFWGSRMLVDPRITPMELARRTGLSHGAIRIRLKRWKAIGFFHGYEVWPNPRLLSDGLRTIDAPLARPDDWDRIALELGEVDGVLSVRDIQEGDGRAIRIYLLDDGPGPVARRCRSVTQILGRKEAVVSREYWIPAPAYTPTKLDWRIVEYYRHAPGTSLQAAASSLRITPKTLALRRDRLIETFSLWWVLDTRSGRIPLVAVYAELASASELTSVRAQLNEELEGWIPCATDGYGVTPAPDARLVVGLAYADTPGRTEEVVRQVRRMKGVTRAYYRIPLEFRSFQGWANDRVGSKLLAAGVPAVARPP